MKILTDAKLYARRNLIPRWSSGTFALSKRKKKMDPVLLNSLIMRSIPKSWYTTLWRKTLRRNCKPKFQETSTVWSLFMEKIPMSWEKRMESLPREWFLGSTKNKFKRLDQLVISSSLSSTIVLTNLTKSEVQPMKTSRSRFLKRLQKVFTRGF